MAFNVIKRFLNAFINKLLWVCIFRQNFLKFINFMMEFKQSEDKLKQRFNKVCTKPNLYSGGIKLIKLVYTPLSVSFLKTMVTNLSFSQSIFTSRKESDPFISVSIENFMFLCSLFIYSRKNCTCSGLLNKTKISSTYLF